MNGIMILFHCESNTGYAIGRLEPIFFQMALALANGDQSKIHFAYPSMAKGVPTTLPEDFKQYVVIDSRSHDHQQGEYIERYISEHGIDTLFGFDQPVTLPTYKYFRRGGIKHFISYWGAPMSSIFNALKLALKKIEISFRKYGPDLYIFESQGMADTALYGRGIPHHKVKVVYLGVDTQKFHPDASDQDYVYSAFDIPRHRRIFFYSGHMEERKGVWVIMKAANQLEARRQSDDWHLLLTGNQPGEERWLEELLTPAAKSRITFGGYRNDIPRLHHGCYAGVIASTGWDSLTCSALEVQASGLPLIISDLPGLREAVAENHSLKFRPQDDTELAEIMMSLLDDPQKQTMLGDEAQKRAALHFSISHQIQSLIRSCRSLLTASIAD